jgi:hypothetical protein
MMDSSHYKPTQLDDRCERWSLTYKADTWPCIAMYPIVVNRRPWNPEKGCWKHKLNQDGVWWKMMNFLMLEDMHQWPSTIVHSLL